LLNVIGRASYSKLEWTLLIGLICEAEFTVCYNFDGAQIS